MKEQFNNILLLSGGVGGAKLVKGFADYLQHSSTEIQVAINTGDDFEHLGLSISPDIDTLCYTLAEVNDVHLGWGLENETWNCLEKLETLNAPTWFQLGDKDLATHIWRTWQLSQGRNLSEITQQIKSRLGISESIHLLPMSHDKINTRIEVYDAQQQSLWLDFQEYFVKARCQPVVKSIQYEHAEQACLAPQLEALLSADLTGDLEANEPLDAIFIAPSNPLLSIAPILAVPSLQQHLKRLKQSIPVIAVNPLIQGKAIKGPTAKLLQELNMACNAQGLANYYSEIINGFVVDELDEDSSAAIEDLGLKVHACNTLMNSASRKESLARACLNFAATMQRDF